MVSSFSEGSDPQEFDCPIGLCQDASGDVYVADSYNKRVQVFGPDLMLKKEIDCLHYPCMGSGHR